MIKKYVKKSLAMISFLGFSSLYAFDIRPMIVNMEPGQTVQVTLSPSSPKEYATYRLEVEGHPDSGFSFKDSLGKDVTSVELREGGTTFSIKAPATEGEFILAFDSRPLDKLYTGELIFARQGLSITVKAKPKPASPVAKTSKHAHASGHADHSGL